MRAAPTAAAPAKAAAPKAAPLKAVPTPAREGAGLSDRLAAVLHELGMAFTADAVEHSQIIESETEIQFVTPPEFSVMLTAGDVQKGLDRLNAGKRRIKLTTGNGGSPAPQTGAPARPAEDEATSRALAHPEVQRFREVFPGAEVRVVRNLKE
jgi:hypothetical protein